MDYRLDGSCTITDQLELSEKNLYEMTNSFKNLSYKDREAHGTVSLKQEN